MCGMVFEKSNVFNVVVFILDTSVLSFLLEISRGQRLEQIAMLARVLFIGTGWQVNLHVLKLNFQISQSVGIDKSSFTCVPFV
jgi:hypothetical protein